MTNPKVQKQYKVFEGIAKKASISAHKFVSRTSGYKYDLPDTPNAKILAQSSARGVLFDLVLVKFIEKEYKGTKIVNVGPPFPVEGFGSWIAVDPKIKNNKKIQIHENLLQKKR